MNKLNLALISSVAFGLISSAAQAVTVNGTNVSFTFDETKLGLFGGYSVVGNSINFLPTAFRAESNNGEGSVTAYHEINIEVRSITAGYDLTSFGFYEAGDYLIDGAGASASASAYLQAVSQTSICGTDFFGTPMTCRDNTTVNASLLSSTDGRTENWNLFGNINLADTAGWGSDSVVTLKLQNNLRATTLYNGETAWIQKKDAAVGITVNPIPVPAAVWLFGSGLVGLAAVARRKMA